MKLYYSKGACSLVNRIIINEIGMEVTYESVDLKTKKTASGKNFLTINPKGAVPALELGNNEVLTENAVILQYLADSANARSLLPDINDLQRYRVLEWVNFITTELHKSFGLLFNPNTMDEMKKNVVMPLVKSKLNFVNQMLDNKSYLAGEAFTLPDAYLFVMLLWSSHFKIDLGEYPHLKRFFHELKQRPSVQLSLEQEGL